jgi:hypothetical protein
VWGFAPAYLVLGDVGGSPGVAVSVAAGASVPVAQCAGSLHGPAQLGYTLEDDEEIVVFALLEVTWRE